MPESRCKRAKLRKQTTRPAKRKSSRRSISNINFLPDVEYYKPGTADVTSSKDHEQGLPSSRQPNAIAADLKQSKVFVTDEHPSGKHLRHVIDGEDQRLPGVTQKQIPVLKRALDILNVCEACPHAKISEEIRKAAQEVRESAEHVRECKSEKYRVAAEISLVFKVIAILELMKQLPSGHVAILQAFFYAFR